MIRMEDALAAKKLSAQMLLQVHDELIFEVPDDEVAATLPVVQHVMQDAPFPAVLLSVPLQVDARAATIGTRRIERIAESKIAAISGSLRIGSSNTAALRAAARLAPAGVDDRAVRRHRNAAASSIRTSTATRCRRAVGAMSRIDRRGRWHPDLEP